MNGPSLHLYSGDGAHWNALIARLPGAHLLQTWEWGQVKAPYGWRSLRLMWNSRNGRAARDDIEGSPQAAALVLKRQLMASGFAARLCVLYVPKGPLLDWDAQPLRSLVLDDLQALARRERAIFIKIDPDVVLGRGMAGEGGIDEDARGKAIVKDLQQRGWLFSGEQVQFRNTVLVDLTAREDELLARMKPKARYNVRLAGKKGVQVRPATIDELPLLYDLYAETAARDGFVIRDEGYYKKVWTTFMRTAAGADQPSAECLVAEVQGEVVAALFVFYFANRAYYLYGMSRASHREKMPNHLLQWEAMERARRRGCTSYDMWGAPEVLSEEDPMWGVFRFKEGFGGEVVRTLGAWDFPASRLWYAAYTRLMPRLLDVMRWHGHERIRRELAGP